MLSAKEYRCRKQTRRRTRVRQGAFNINKNTQPKDRHLRHVQAKLDVDFEPNHGPRRRGRHFQLRRDGGATWDWRHDDQPGAVAPQPHTCVTSSGTLAMHILAAANTSLCV